MMLYRGYMGSVEFDEPKRLFHGKLLFIRDKVIYQAKDADGMIAAFHQAVDDYLAKCQEIGKKPQRPFSGTFNVRVGPVLHRKAALAAERQNRTLNQLVIDALDKALQEPAS